MSFVSDRLNFNELKKNYIGGLVGGIIGGWVLMTVIGSMMNPPFLEMLADNIFGDPTAVLMSGMVHIMMSLVYGLLFAFLVGKSLDSDIKLIIYGVVYGLILMVILLISMMMMGTDVIAMMGDLVLVMMIMINHIVYGGSVGFSLYYFTK